MNNIIIVMCVVTMACSCAPAEIKNFVLEQPFIENCEVALCDDTLVVACITKPIFKRSDRLKFENLLITKLKEKFCLNKVFVTYDLRVLYELSKLDTKNDKQKHDYFESLVEILSNRVN